MANQFTYLSVLPSSTPAPAGAGKLGYVQFLNTDWIPKQVGGGGGGTTNNFVYNSSTVYTGGTTIYTGGTTNIYTGGTTNIYTGGTTNNITNNTTNYVGPAISAGTVSRGTGTVVLNSLLYGATFGMATDGNVTAAAPFIGMGIGPSVLFNETNSGHIVFQNTNGVSWGSSSFSITSVDRQFFTQITAAVRTDYASSDHTHGNPTLALTNLSGSTASASNGLTLSLSAAAPGAAAAPPVRWLVPPWAAVNQALITNMSNVNNVPFFMPFFNDGALTGDEFHWIMSRATNGSNSFTVDLGIYSIVNSTSLSLASSTRAEYVATDTASQSGIRIFEMSMGNAMSTLGAGAWVLGIAFSATATVRGNYSLMGNATVSGPNSNIVLQGTNSYAAATAHMLMPFFGRYTATTGALPANVRMAAGASDLIGGQSGASQPIPMCWTIANHYA
jgi:hypothetical protein